MNKNWGWGLAVLSFCALAFAAGHQPAHTPTQWVTGNQLQAPPEPQHGEGSVKGVRGVVNAVTTKSTGTRVLRLAADDGAPLIVLVMPTVDARLPNVGQRIEVVGRMLDAGVLTIEGADQLKVLPPLTADESRALYTCTLTDRERTARGAHFATMNYRGKFLGRAIIPSSVKLQQPEREEVAVYGYHNAEGLFVVERIDVLDYN